MNKIAKIVTSLAAVVIISAGCGTDTPPPNPLAPVEKASEIPNIAESHNSDVADLTDQMNSGE